MVGLSGLEPPTSRLSGVRSNQLSYRPLLFIFIEGKSFKTEYDESNFGFVLLLRKEVIHPHLPVRIPCYDLTPIINPTLDGSLHCWLGHRFWVLLTFVV